MAPTLSSVRDNSKAPSRGTRACVGLKPTRPHSAAGMRKEPPVSEPRPATARPSATLTAAPDDEPPGMRCTDGSQGLRGVPKCGLKPTPENANSVMLVRPTISAPAAFSRATATASRAAGGSVPRMIEPAVVVTPASSNRSLMLTGSPCRGRDRSANAAPSRARAAASTPATSSCVNTAEAEGCEVRSSNSRTNASCEPARATRACAASKPSADVARSPTSVSGLHQPHAQARRRHPDEALRLKPSACRAARGAGSCRHWSSAVRCGIRSTFGRL